MSARPWLWILLTLFPFAASAAVSINVDPEDTPFVIVGWLDDLQAGSFVGTLRLTAERSIPGLASNKSDNPADEAHHGPGGDAEAKGGANALDPSGSGLTILLLPSELKLASADKTRPQPESPDNVIQRSNVTLSGNPRQLSLGVPTDVAVHVGGIGKPGIYRGTVKLALAASPNQATAVPIEVHAHARPSLTPLSNSKELKLDLVQRGDWGDWLAGRLLPKSALADTWDLGFKNTSAAQADWGVPAVEIRGEKTGSQLTTQVSPAEQGSIPPGEIGNLKIELTRGDMAPDHYTGTLYLSIAGAKEYLEVPVNLNVRSGPFFPLVAIILGVMLGWFVEYMQKRGEPQAAQLGELDRVARTLARAHPNDQSLLAPQLAGVREAVYSHRLEKAAADLASIERRIVQLEQLRKLETTLLPGSATPETKKALEAIATARRKIDDAEDAVASIEEARKAVDASTNVAESPLAFGGAERGETGAGGQVARGTSWWTGVRAFLGDPVRRQERRAYVTLHLGRPLMQLLLLLGLVAVGFSTLYLNQPIFGAQPFGDYLGLILWGLSADVARRTLTNLSGPAR